MFVTPEKQYQNSPLPAPELKPFALSFIPSISFHCNTQIWRIGFHFMSYFLSHSEKLWYLATKSHYFVSIRRVLSVLCIENRIYIRGEFTREKCKTAILFYCFQTAGVLHIFMLYNLLGPGISFYRKYKINIKRKQNYEIGWFHNWLMIISNRPYAFCLLLYKRWFFVISLNRMMFFIHLIHYKVYLTV